MVLLGPLSLSVLACTGYTTIYVGSLYVFPRLYALLRRKQYDAPKRRDDPSVICQRLISVGLATAISFTISFSILYHHEPKETHPFFHALAILKKLGLGLPMPSFLTSAWLPLEPPMATWICQWIGTVLKTLVLTGSVYLGTMVDDIIHTTRPFQMQWFKAQWRTLSFWRNYVVGPVTEEIVFRSCMLATIQSLHPTFSTGWLIFSTPLYFGLAHLHHALETYRQGGYTQRAKRVAIMSSTLQFGYTTIFGWYANFLLLRTGTMTAPLTAHIFCNSMGLPSIPSMEKAWPQIAVVGCHILGVLTFIAGLFPLAQ